MEEQLSDLKKAFHFLGEELTICYADPLLPANIRWGRKFYLRAGKEKNTFFKKDKILGSTSFFRQEIFRHKHFTCKCPRCEVCEITLIACELKSMSSSSNSSCQKMGNFFGCTLKAKGLSNFLPRNKSWKRLPVTASTNTKSGNDYDFQGNVRI